MKVKVPIPFPVLAAMLFVAASLQTRAQSIIIQHSGATDPFTEGFSGDSIGSSPVVNDMGVNAWATQCHALGNMSSDGSYYQYNLTSQQQAEVSGLGWIFSVDLRITTTNASKSAGFFAGVDTGFEAFNLQFGSTSNGDPSVSYVDDERRITNTVNLSGAGSSYNLYQLIYNPSLDQVGLFINGAAYGDYVPQVEQGGPYGVYFGTGAHTGTGYEQANWNLVSLSVPEPSILSLILAGGGIFIFVRICKKIILRSLFTFNRFASFSNDLFKVNVQSQSNPQQSVQSRDSLFLLNKSYCLTRQSSFLSNQVERKPAFCTRLFQETRDLRTNNFRYFAD